MAYGVSFQPGAQQNGNGTGERDRSARATPVQQAIQLLSLRLPSVVGARALAPQGLLQGQGSAGLATSGMSLEAFLRRLMQQSGAGIPAQAQGVFDVPSAQQDREGGISRSLPQPGPQPQSGGSAPPLLTPGPPRFTPGQTTAGGPSPSPEWSAPKPTPEPLPMPTHGFGEGPYGGSEDRSQSETWLSPWERQYGRYPD